MEGGEEEIGEDTPRHHEQKRLRSLAVKSRETRGARHSVLKVENFKACLFAETNRKKNGGRHSEVQNRGMKTRDTGKRLSLITVMRMKRQRGPN